MEAWDVADLKSMSAADSNTPSPPMEMDDTPINTDENTNGESKEPCSFSFLAKEAEVDTIAHQITRFMALSEERGWSRRWSTSCRCQSTFKMK